MQLSLVNALATTATATTTATSSRPHEKFGTPCFVLMRVIRDRARQRQATVLWFGYVGGVMRRRRNVAGPSFGIFNLVVWQWCGVVHSISACVREGCINLIKRVHATATATTTTTAGFYPARHG